MNLKYLILISFLYTACIINAQPNNSLISSEGKNWYTPSQFGGEEIVQISINPPKFFKFDDTYGFSDSTVESGKDIARIDIYIRNIDDFSNGIKNSPNKFYARRHVVNNIYIIDTVINRKNIALSKWKFKGNIGFWGKTVDIYQYQIFISGDKNCFSIIGAFPMDSVGLDSIILQSILTFDYKYSSVYGVKNFYFDTTKLNLKIARYSYKEKESSYEFTNNGQLIPSSPDFTKIKILEKTKIDIPDLSKMETFKNTVINLPITSYKYKIIQDTIELIDQYDKFHKRITKDSVAYLIYMNYNSKHPLIPKLISKNSEVNQENQKYEFMSSNGMIDLYLLILFDEKKIYIVEASCSSRTPKKMEKIKSYFKEFSIK